MMLIRLSFVTSSIKKFFLFISLLFSILTILYYVMNNEISKRICRTSSMQVSIIPFVPILILHPNLTYYSMVSIWQARQLNDEIHVLYDHNATVQRTCNQSDMKIDNCFSSVSTNLTILIKSLLSSKIYFIDLNIKYLQTNVDSFKVAYSQGNNKSLFDQHHPLKWIYEEWCAIRWLYAYNYALKRKFDVFYLQDSDVLLYSNVTMEYDYLQPIDTAISSSVFRRSTSGHNAFFKIKILESLINLMLETWHQRTDVAGYVRANVIPDTFYFVHLFEHRNKNSLRRAKGMIIYLLNDIYYSNKYNRSSGRAFDRYIGDDFDGRYSLKKITFPGKMSDNLKNISWITETNSYFDRPHMSSSLSVRYPFIYHRELQENIRMITLHFVGYRKKFMQFYTQRYLQNFNVDQLLNSNFFPHKQLI